MGQLEHQTQPRLSFTKGSYPDRTVSRYPPNSPSMLFDVAADSLPRQRNPLETMFLLDPSSEQTPPHRARAPKLAGIEGATIGLLDISKARGDVFLNRIADHLIQLGARVERYRKPTFARNAPRDLREKIAQTCDAVIEALAD